MQGLTHLRDLGEEGGVLAERLVAGDVTADAGGDLLGDPAGPRRTSPRPGRRGRRPPGSSGSRTPPRPRSPPQIRASSVCMRSRVISSSAPKGSSISSRRGRSASDRAIATRCCMPPESWSGRCLAKSARPTISTSSADPRLALARATHRAARAAARCWRRPCATAAARPAGRRCRSPGRPRARAAGLPKTSTVPRRGLLEVGDQRASASTCRSPSGPIRATNSPAATLRSTSDSATTWDLRVPNVLLSPLTRTASVGPLAPDPVRTPASWSVAVMSLLMRPPRVGSCATAGRAGRRSRRPAGRGRRLRRSAPTPWRGRRRTGRRR